MDLTTVASGQTVETCLRPLRLRLCGRDFILRGYDVGQKGAFILLGLDALAICHLQMTDGPAPSTVAGHLQPSPSFDMQTSKWQHSQALKREAHIWLGDPAELHQMVIDR